MRFSMSTLCILLCAVSELQEIMFLQELNSQHHENIIRLLNVLKADNDKARNHTHGKARVLPAFIVQSPLSVDCPLTLCVVCPSFSVRV